MKRDNLTKVALTGGNGLIGSRIIELLGKDFQFIPLNHQQLDITDKQQSSDVLTKVDFDLFLHLAAYTNVDGAETNKELAYRINVEGTRNVFEPAVAKNKKFIYISTDFVFDGKKPPYFEDSQPTPICEYGKSKYEGEKIIGNKAMIVRISYPYRAHFEKKKDFVRSIRSMLEQGKTLKMVKDSLMTPTFIDDIAFALKHLMNNYSPEIYHVVGGNSLSPYEAGRLIAKTFSLNESLIQPTTYEEYFQGKAYRPRNSEIKSKKNNFYPMKTFAQGLSAFK